MHKVTNASIAPSAGRSGSDRKLRTVRMSVCNVHDSRDKSFICGSDRMIDLGDLADLGDWERKSDVFRAQD